MGKKIFLIFNILVFCGFNCIAVDENRPVGGRAAGMGNSSVMLSDLWAVYHNPAGLAAGDYLLFTYRRTDLSVSAGVVAGCEYGTTLLAPWATAQNGVAGVVVQVDNDYATFAPPVTATDRVRVYVPQGAQPMLFGRLNVMVP